MQSGIHRREWLRAAAGATASSLALGAQTAATLPRTKLGMPGLYPGRVISVHHPLSIAAGVYQKSAVHQMMHRGMAGLTGADDWAAAWRQFVEPGDVVGIKLNPVGRPCCISDPTVLIPNSLAARKIRIAISPRFNASSFFIKLRLAWAIHLPGTFRQPRP